MLMMKKPLNEPEKELTDLDVRFFYLKKLYNKYKPPIICFLISQFFILLSNNLITRFNKSTDPISVWDIFCTIMANAFFFISFWWFYYIYKEGSK